MFQPSLSARAVSLCFAAFWLPAAALADERATGPMPPREAIEAIVKEYLLTNPGIVRDALRELQAREEAARAAKVTEAVVTHRDALVADPASPVLGNPNGDVTVVEFQDYRCGYCKRLGPAMTALLKRDPQVRLVIKELPILGPDSEFAARAALVAHRQGKYPEFHRALLDTPEVTRESVLALGTRLGLAPGLEAAVEDAAVSEIIRSNQMLAGNLEIAGTPALVIGGRVVPGAADVETLAMFVAAERAKLTKVAAAQPTPVGTK